MYSYTFFRCPVSFFQCTGRTCSPPFPLPGLVAHHSTFFVGAPLFVTILAFTLSPAPPGDAAAETPHGHEFPAGSTFASHLSVSLRTFDSPTKSRQTSAASFYSPFLSVFFFRDNMIVYESFLWDSPLTSSNLSVFPS